MGLSESSTSTATRTVPSANRASAGLEGVSIGFVGQAGAWFEWERDEASLLIRPTRALPRRCTIRPAAMFEQDRGFFEVATVMGRLPFANGSTDPQRYTPFSRDPQRRLRELFLPVETTPEDEWPTSTTRWSNFTAIAKRLLSTAGITWSGLTSSEIEALTEHLICTEPVECCVLHGLAAWTHPRGDCVIEIGTFRGRSLTMLALGLRSVGSAAKIVSVDPHELQPTNFDQARMTLAPFGEQRRVMQYVGGSDDAWRILRPGCASMVFIDGDHGRKQVLADFLNYKELVAPGGVVAFHDYGFGNHSGQPDNHPDVRAVVDEIVFNDPQFCRLLLAHTLMTFIRKPA